MKEKVLMAMSGGIDSSVAALLILQQGYHLVGITFSNFDPPNLKNSKTEIIDANPLTEAKLLAERLGIEHHIIDIKKEFEELIIQNFINEYLDGKTPNPCVRCNRLIKWGLLLDVATQYGCTKIATGHYAQIVCENNRYFIRKGKDTTKDQSYFLWMLTQEQLKSTLFPLGNLSKEEVRQIAFDNDFKTLAQKGESQEICFIPDHDYRHFLQQNVKDYQTRFPSGDFINKKGEVIGKHKGYPNYTIGQRKGLGIALGYPAYVIAIYPKKNQVVLGKKEDLLSQTCTVNNVNLMKYKTLSEDETYHVKVRYRTQGAEALLKTEKNGRVICIFSQPVDAITPGQSAVFYENNDLIGGGIIV